MTRWSGYLLENEENITHVNIICCVTWGVCKTQHYKITLFFVFFGRIRKGKKSTLLWLFLMEKLKILYPYLVQLKLPEI